jgi:chromosome segregation ATPase
MRIIISFLTLTLLFSSCKEEAKTKDSAELEKIADLESQIKQMAHESELKDSMVAESLTFFNEIQTNLEAIDIKNEAIRIKSTDSESENVDKAWILQEINHINYLREENARKVNRLTELVKQSGLKIKELESMIERLYKDIQFKDAQIDELQAELQRVDQEYSRLFDAYQEKEVKVEELSEQINTAYYTYGTEKELIDNKVLEKKKGFVGLVKKANIADNINEKYFEKIDISKKKQIIIEGKDIQILTNHISKSYHLVEAGNNTKLIIDSPLEFWKISKYLVIVAK